MCMKKLQIMKKICEGKCSVAGVLQAINECISVIIIKALFSWLTQNKVYGSKNSKQYFRKLHFRVRF